VPKHKEPEAQKGHIHHTAKALSLPPNRKHIGPRHL
jgi:hypothetical protein